MLYVGDALGTQEAAGLLLASPTAGFSTALTAWLSATDGAQDTLFTSHNHQWFTRPGMSLP